VRTLQIEIVSWTVEIDRQQKNCIKAILCPIGLGLRKQHFFGQPVGRISLLGITVPNIVFFEWHWGKLGISAYGSQRNKLLDSVVSRVLHQLNPHNRIVVEKTAGIGAIRAANGDPLLDPTKGDKALFLNRRGGCVQWP
jgi:hypothetical protein